MTNTETTTQPRLITASLLAKSPFNARKTAPKGGIEELKASILSHGLMQNLVVTEAGDGVYHVIAGGRRLQAIHSLQYEGKLLQDYAVPCQVVAEASSLEMSLAENVVRLAMHPADQFEAFAELIEQGHTAAEVAARFGVEESLVHKRMKLARVAPELFEEYRNDGLTLECLMAFAVTDDHGRQLHVFKSLRDWQKNDPSAIRDALTEQMVEAGSKLARFVGLDAYAAAGGVTRSDLFAEETYLEDPELLHTLADQKLGGIRRDLEADGWGWIDLNPERDYSLINRCTRLRPRLVGVPAELLDRKARLDAELESIDQMLDDTESDESLDQQQAIQDQLDEVERQLAAYVGFDDEQKRLAGCFISIGQDGTPCLDKGLVKPEHRKQLARLLGQAGDDRPEKVKPKHSMPDSLRRDLAAERLQIAQVEIARHPAIAFNLLVFQVASSLLADSAFSVEAADVEFRRSRLNRSDDVEPTAAGEAFASLAKSLPVDWLKPKTEAARFEGFRLLPDTAKQELLAYCVAMTLKPRLAPAPGQEATAYDLALSLTSADVAAYWRPTSDNLLNRITRDQLLAIGSEVLGEPWTQSRAKDKKSSLVGELHRAFADPEKSGRAPEQIEKLKHWLPACMGFAAQAPQPMKAKKAKKAA